MAEAGKKPWSDSEIEAIVDSYFWMLRADLSGQHYVKSHENAKLQDRIGRSHGSVERKHQNISAVLLELGSGDFLRGYVPLKNAQRALREAVVARWEADPDIELLMRRDAELPVPAPGLDLVWSAPPGFTVDRQFLDRRRSPVRTDFLKLDAENRELGLAGERAIVDLERRALAARGLERLAKHVKHVALEVGDGLGYDVLSFDLDGNEKFIEVKTTRKPKQFPFLVTRNEVDFSVEEKQRFHLYRVFDFGRPKQGFFTMQGALTAGFELEPTQFAGWPKADVADATTPLSAATSA